MVWWLSQDTVPSHWDEGRHLRNTLLYFDMLRKGELRNFFFGYYAYYPPFLYQLTTVLYVVFGTSRLVPMLLNIVIMGVTYSLCFILGKKFFSYPVALVGAVLFLFTPLVTHLGHDFLLDMPLTMWVLAFYLVALAHPEKKDANALLFGLIFGFGMMTKWTFVLYAVGAVGVVLFRIQGWGKEVFRRGFIAALVAIIVAGGWYGLHTPTVWSDFRHQVKVIAVNEGDPAFGTFDFFFYYLGSLCNDYINLGGVLLALFGLLAFWKKKSSKKWLAFFAIIPAVVGMTLITNKDPRYILPILPLVTLLIAYGIAQTKGFMRGGIVLLVGWITVSQFFAGLGVGPFPQQKITIPSPIRYIAWYDKKDPPIYFAENHVVYPTRVGEVNVYNPFSYMGRTPRRENWHEYEIAKLLVPNAKNTTKVKFCLLSENMPFFNNDALSYPLARQGVLFPVEFIQNNEIQHCTALVVRPSGILDGDAVSKIATMFSTRSPSFTLPDGTEVIVFSSPEGKDLSRNI